MMALSVSGTSSLESTYILISLLSSFYTGFRKWRENLLKGAIKAFFLINS
jgi:hypothetical protein